MKLRCLTVLLGLIAADLLIASEARADGPPRLTQTYPRDAALVTVADAATLQDVLDTETVVRLERGDYRESPPITLRSGQRLHGIRSMLPQVTIEPGATGIVLSNVASELEDGISFPPSALVTRHNLFFEVRSIVRVDGATLEENTFLGMNGGFEIDTSAGGWLRNNRFIRVRLQHVYPLLTMIGDADHQSYGNVFLWANQLTQPHEMVRVENQRDVTFVGWDDEAYAGVTDAPIYGLRGIDTLRLWAMGGRSESENQPLFDIDAADVQLTAVTMGGPTPQPIVLSSNVERVFALDSREPSDDGNPGGMRLAGTSSINNNTGSPLRDHGELVTAALPDATAEALSSLYTVHTGEPWERPVFDAIADPTGPSWDEDLASKPDSTATLQERIDTEPVVLLEPGTYYVSSSLRIRRETRIIGSGADVTAIVAKSPDIDIFVDDDAPEEARYSIEIDDLTLQGGRNGVHLYGPPGVYRQYSDFLYSGVVFRDFSHAGFFVDQTGGFDNGLFYNVAFVDCGTGFKQYVDPAADPAGPNTGYVDKVMFYGSQFVGNRFGAELRAQRADNLNAFVACRFEDNTEGALIAESNNDLQLVHSDLINNGGAPSVSGVADIISCYFRADELGESLITNGRVEGTRFERGSSPTAKIYEQRDDPFYAANDAWANYSFDYVVNSSADDIDVGNVAFGIFLHSDLPARPDLSKPAAMVWVGEVTTVVDGEVDPRAQLLVGVSYADPGAGGGGAGGDGGGDAGGGDAGVGGQGSGAEDGNGATSGGAGESTGTLSGGAESPGTSGATGDGDDGGCGCFVAPRPTASPWWLAPVTPLVALALRRRRRATLGLRAG